MLIICYDNILDNYKYINKILKKFHHSIQNKMLMNINIGSKIEKAIPPTNIVEYLEEK